MADLQEYIEQEFGKSPYRLYREMRPYSTFRTIAATMGISVWTLKRWRIGWGEPPCSRGYSDDRVFDEFSQKRRPDLQEVERELVREFGKSPHQLYLELRPHSTFRTIAATMGVSLDTLRGWRRKWGEPLCGPNDKVCDEFSRWSRVDTAARKLGYDDAVHAVGCMTKEGLGNSEIGKVLHCSKWTVIRHKPREWKQRDYD